MSGTVQLPLSNFEKTAHTHALLGFWAFLVVLPIGVLGARYARTFVPGHLWFWPHAIINFVVTGPLVFAAFALGVKTTNISKLPHYRDPHQKGGLALLILYILQVLLGLFIHFVKFPRVRWLTGRSPQNYLHAILGLVILALASWQTHYGLYMEWPFITGNLHPISPSFKHFWTAMMVVIWLLYGLGLALVPRQYKQERAARRSKMMESTEMKDGLGQPLRA